MFSSFRALRALLVLASVWSPVLSFPTTTPAGISARALSKRNIGDYIDNLIYLDANKTSIYSAISINAQTYAAVLDNHWSGLLVYGDKFNGSTASEHNITVEGVTIDVEDGRETIGILEEDVTLEFFHVTQWPSHLPHLSYNDIESAYWGLDINNPMSPIYTYFDARWPSDQSKWYYDIVIFYDWLSDESKVGIDFAGIMVSGQTVDWTKVLDITQQQADSYGLPNLDGINSQKEISLNPDGTFNLDSTVWLNGQQTTVNSTVPNTPSGKYVGDIYTNTRWSTYPDEVVNGLYNISGSKYFPDSTFGYYQIPCDAKVSFEFSIDGVKYQVAEDALIAKNPWGDQCIGSIFTKGQAVAAVPEWDAKIGFQLLSSFYFRAGMNQTSDEPYYKLLSLPAPTWEGYTSYDFPGSASTTSTGQSGYSSAASGYSGSVTTDAGTSTVSPISAPTSSPGNTYSTGASTVSPSTVSGSSGVPATQIAGNLADTGDSSSTNDDYWKHRAELFEILMIVFASLFGLTAIGSIVMCVRGRGGGKAQPSAYRSIHETESSGTHAPLYGAEGGQSRYADPYHDKE
ncbi:hypothetical protein LXA43DRAFT_970466 [Ganoderma leucocontextum]|nr:hypothetical protein LXA43DRAFT_970466 [Ganoderma leucocontextum]